MIFQPKWPRDKHAYYKPCVGASQALTVDDTVRSPTVPESARMARVFFRGGTVRMTLDGTNPVAATTGVNIFDGYEEFFSFDELATMKLIREGATNGTVHIIYYA